uniref:Putative actin n=1 Tax=Xenopsylla cheopis TaxID=163159 RepID=A0A6M2DL07_XENCH
MSTSANMILGGDEIGALVFDPGHHSIRIGYAQEDTPKGELPSYIGVGPGEIDYDTDVKIDNSITKQTKNKFYIGTNFLNVPRSNTEVHSFMKDGMIENWDLFEKVLDYSYEKLIQSSSELHPVLFSESAWNVRNKREQLTELMFEKYNVPAYFLVKNAVLAAFSNGRSTALVIDSGASHTSAIPVQDGYVIQQAVVKSPLGGDYLGLQCRQYLESQGIDITPIYKVQSKEQVKDKEKPKFTLKSLPEKITSSWHNYMLKQLLQDFQMTIVQIGDSTYDERTAAAVPAVHYEFPTGCHQDFGPERFRLGETLFDHAMLGAGQIAATSVGMCDIDARPSLYNAVVVTGGNSLVQGFPERLNKDLMQRTQSSMRVKMISANGSAERRFGAWIGGSILASIGTFQQMWISTQEYQEGGKNQVERKCP